MNDQSIYTKEQKHEIYTRMLYLYNFYIAAGYLVGYSWVLAQTLIELNLDNLQKIGSNKEYQLQPLAELTKHKPEELKFFPYWFDYKDTESRINVLKQAIKETL